ncbi:MAG TPA: carboxylate--amine ligase [Candidatus Thermoplasmatota archaeon]|nr:carboxylate--amine ligase [Candidatus Thermoplasmatota archaeon]
MARIYLGGAGGAPTNNVIKSLRESHRKDYLIGASSTPSDLFLADTEERHVVPRATAPEYVDRLLSLLQTTRADFMHVQNDYEVQAVSRLRSRIQAAGVKLFMPSAQVVEDCIDKQRSYAIWQKSGLPVPRTRLLRNPDELEQAFHDLGPKLWLRATVGGGGRGALPTDNRVFARHWIDYFEGWGTFTAAEILSPDSVTWLSIWSEGELVVAQTRRRRSWSFGDRTLSGVTGVTGVAETASDAVVDDIAERAIRAIDVKPNGIYGVDMTYDANGVPNPTEINISRFFTTVHFFTRAGLNLPAIYCDLALEGKLPKLERRVNPLPDGLVWIRGMDVEPVLTTHQDLARIEGR